MKFKFTKLCIALVISSVMASAPAEASKSKIHAPVFAEMSSFHFAISTHSAQCQKYFDQGMALYFSFKSAEALRSLQEAVRLDPKCAMCQWGVALVDKTKVQAPLTGHEEVDGRKAITKAKSLKGFATLMEHDLIETMALRYQQAPLDKKGSKKILTKNKLTPEALQHKEQLQFAASLKTLTVKYPDDNNIKLLYAAALWQAHSVKHLSEASATTSTINQIAQSVLGQDPLNIAANHLYVHTNDPFNHPEKTLPIANARSHSVPQSEHLAHIPAHLYYLMGQYHKASLASQKAIAQVVQYNKTCLAQGFAPEANYTALHDYDFLSKTAMLEGRKDIALKSAQTLVNAPFSKWLARDASLQQFVPTPYFVKARFGQWQALLQEPKPQNTYGYAQGMWYYVHGLALVHTNSVEPAATDLNKLQDIIRRGAIAANLNKQGLDMLHIAEEVLTAAIENSKGEMGKTLTHLETAVKIQDAIGQNSQLTWYMPMREVLANAYLTWGDPKNAAAIYETELNNHRDNPWALYGLNKSLRQIDFTQKARYVEKEFKKAWVYAEIPAPVMLF